jgi:hypothetical protein
MKAGGVIMAGSEEVGVAIQRVFVVWVLRLYMVRLRCKGVK